MRRKNLRIGVLMGGFSSEREISLKSGAAVVEALRGLGYEVLAFDFHTEEELAGLLQLNKVDGVFNALHGAYGEDGRVQALLESMNILYTGSGVRASRLAMDKIVSRRIFEDNGLFVPEYKVLGKDTAAVKIDSSLGFPLVVKPVHQGSSIGLSIVDDFSSLPAAVNHAFRFDVEVIVEKYIKGRELTVGILEDNALPVIEVVPRNKFYDFQAKYTAGMTEYRVPAALSDNVTDVAQKTALTAHRVLGCRCFSRVDMILDAAGRVFVLEVNTIPGLTATSLLPKSAAACGIAFPQLCEKMVLSALESRLQEAVSRDNG
ncbi:MAG: D-alanine--D-alanine ligase [Candidatus Omnitrophica bacterium]|nr:D-alanine--D-alanine ligase [Candidatus Omnitrophota bacterium]MBU4477998.1 D-alanine--D-alanine ligase [Candidatus Omnitrophota bacterium]MCG2703931.1 D-alanine--D-alanine ligase [Candidatus Omnitrophota bacterium]